MRDFLKMFLLMGVSFGAIMGFLGWLDGESASEAVIGGGISGTFFGLAMAVFMSWFATRMRSQFEGKCALEPGETVLREGLSNHFERTAIGGYLYLTNRRLHFKPHRFLQGKAREVQFPLADIAEAAPYRVLGVIPNGLRIRASVGEERFTLEKNKEWAEAIARAKAA